MNSSKVKALIKKYSYLFWYIREDKKENISHETLVEFILNFGDENAVKQLFEVLGVDYVADIFNKRTLPGKRTNYLPLIINFFKLYFSRHAHRSIQRRAN